ncbi:hypothetical protein ABIB82_006511 [Bradyrhizobium sp. i1.8.4]
MCNELRSSGARGTAEVRTLLQASFPMMVSTTPPWGPDHLGKSYLMRKNLWLAVVYNVPAAPIAGSSVIVMLNALRARAKKVV